MSPLGAKATSAGWLKWLASFPGVSRTPHDCKQPAVRRVFVDLMVAYVREPEIALRVEAAAVRQGEQILAPRAQKAPLPIKNENRMRRPLKHVDLPLRIHRHPDHHAHAVIRRLPACFGGPVRHGAIHCLRPYTGKQTVYRCENEA